MVRKNSSQTIEYRVTVDDPFASDVFEVTNQGSVSADDISNFTTNEVVIPIMVEELTVRKNANVTGVADPEEVVRYTISIDNTGNQDDTNVRMSDTLPDTVSLNPGTLTLNGASVANEGSGNTVVVNVGTLYSNSDAAVITFDVTVAGEDAFETGTNTIVNEAVVTSDNFPDPDGKRATVETGVSVGPYLLAEKRGGLYHDVDRNGVIGPGDILYYELTFTNAGNQTATNVQITDTPDAQNRSTTIIAGTVTASRGSVTSGNTQGDTSVEVTVAELVPGEQVLVSFRVTIDDVDVDSVVNQGQATCAELPDAFKTNEVATPVTPNPIIIAKPVVSGTTSVEGTALANTDLTLEVLRTEMPTMTVTSTADGTFSFENLQNEGIQLETGMYVLVKGYNTQDIARVEDASNQNPDISYISATNADCVSDPNSVTIEGFNWPDENSDYYENSYNDTKIVLFCDGEEWYVPVVDNKAKIDETYEWSGAFTYTNVPFSDRCASGESHTIKAKVYENYGARQQHAHTPIEHFEASVKIPAFCAQPPDIQVESLTLTKPISETRMYAPITVTVVLTNTSTTDVTSLFEVDLFVDAPDNPYFFFEYESVDHIGVSVLEGKNSGSGPISFEMYVPEGFSDTEPHTLTVKADTFEQILEIEELKNVRTLSAQATLTGTPPSETPPISSTLPPGGIQGETWLIIQDEVMPQNGVKVYAETTVTDTTVTYGPVYSDNLGRYTLADLPPATYTVIGEYELIEDSDKDGKLERVLYQDTVTGIQVSSNMTTTGIYLILEPLSQ
jgi:uncharacterized repeat protein (TIGR01451 family)